MIDQASKDLAEQVAGVLVSIRAQKPLVHHLTNFVVMNETANATLAIGALPVMAHAPEEVEEMAGIASAVVLNIGTLYADLVRSMILAGKTANQRGIPVVLDPVGAGATRFRTESSRRILDEVEIAVIRGNAGEISVLGGFGGEVRGVESISAHGELGAAVKEVARQTGTVVAMTGVVDYVSDGVRTVSIQNGSDWLARVTGTGCMSTAMVATAAGVEKDMVVAAASGLGAFAVAGEMAAAGAHGPGSYHAALYDALANLTPERLRETVKMRVLEG